VGDDANVLGHDADHVLFAYDYPLLSVFWSIFVFFGCVLWVITVLYVMVDIFRSQDLGGVAKAAWLFFVIIAPFLGVLVYLTARGDEMATRAMANAEARNAASHAT
jgi:phospholipase D-like protein